MRNDQPDKPHVFHNAKDMYDYIIELGMINARQGKNLFVYAHNHEFDWYRYKGHKDKRMTIYSMNPFIVRVQLPADKYGGKVTFLGSDALFRGKLVARWIFYIIVIYIILHLLKIIPAIIKMSIAIYFFFKEKKKFKEKWYH